MASCTPTAKLPPPARHRDYRRANFRRATSWAAEPLENRRLLAAVAVTNASFESPALSAGTSAYDPAGASWAFVSTAGIVNGAGGLGAPTAPNGAQAAFIQTDREASQYNGNQDGTISQSLTFPATGYYSINFDAAACASDTGGAVAAEESLMVTLDGTPVLTGMHPTSSAYSVISGTFATSAGSHTLALVSTGPDSTTIFLDQVQITSVTVGLASQLVFSNVPLSLGVGIRSSSMTLEMEDANGLPVTAPAGGVSITLSSTSATGEFFSSANSIATTIIIPSGASTASFTYQDSASGNPTITAAAAGLSSATQTESVQNVTANSFLRTSGTSIVNGRGQTVQLRGVNLGSWLIMEGWMSPLDSSGLPDEYGVIQTLDNRFGVAEEQSLLHTYEQNWITTQDLINIKNAGFNVIRVPVWWGDFETLNGQWRSDAFTELDWLVNTAGAMGLYTIIDMHGVVGGESTSDDTGQANLDDYWSSTYDQQQTNLLMQNIALHYAFNPMVAAYDLMNEPMNAPSDSAVINAYKGLYSAVRAVDTNHIDIIEGTFDQWNWSMLPNPASEGWTDVVYEMHEYQWNDTGNSSGVEAGTNNQVSDFENHAYYDVPDYVGEFNDFGTGSSTWQYTFQQYDNNNVSWSFWAYKATDGTVSSQDSWGLYDPIRQPAAPRIQTASISTIQSDWTKITTASYFAINPLIQTALADAGVTPTAAAISGPTLYLKMDADGAHLDVWNNTTGTGSFIDQLVLNQISTFTINAPSGGSSSVTIDCSAGNCIPEGGISIAGNGATTVNLIGSGANYADSLAMTSGSITFNNETIAMSGVAAVGFDPHGSVDALALGSGATLTLASPPAGGGIVSRVFSSLAVAAGAELDVATPTNETDRALLVVSGLSLATSNGLPDATLDLGGNDMDIRSGNLSSIDQDLQSGFNANGANPWTGEGISSSAAAATLGRALGAILNNAGTAALYGSGDPLGPFDGASPSAADVLIRYTWFGDANLDGAVTAADYALIDDGFNRNLSGWYHGDFNYDGAINGDDYSLIDNSFNMLGTGSPAIQIASSLIATAEVRSNSLSPTRPATLRAWPAAATSAPFAFAPATASNWADQILLDAGETSGG